MSVVCAQCTREKNTRRSLGSTHRTQINQTQRSSEHKGRAPSISLSTVVVVHVILFKRPLHQTHSLFFSWLSVRSLNNSRKRNRTVNQLTKNDHDVSIDEKNGQRTHPNIKTKTTITRNYKNTLSSPLGSSSYRVTA